MPMNALQDASVALIPVASEPHPSSTDTMAIRTTPSYRTFLPRFFSKTPRHVPRSSNQGEVEDVEPLADSPSSLNASPAPPKSSNRKLRLTLRLPKLSLKKRTTSSPQGDLVVALTEQVPNSPVGEVAPVVSRFTKLSKALCLRKTTTTATSSFLSFKNLNLGFKMPTVSLFKRSIKTSVVPPTQKASPIAFVPAPAHFTEDRHVLNWPKATTTNVERVFLDMTIDDVTEKVNVFIHTPIAPTPSSIKKFSFKLSNLTARPTAAVQALLDMGFSPLKRSS